MTFRRRCQKSRQQQATSNVTEMMASLMAFLLRLQSKSHRARSITAHKASRMHSKQWLMATGTTTTKIPMEVQRPPTRLHQPPTCRQHPRTLYMRMLPWPTPVGSLNTQQSSTLTIQSRGLGLLMFACPTSSHEQHNDLRLSKYVVIDMQSTIQERERNEYLLFANYDYMLVACSLFMSILPIFSKSSIYKQINI